MSDWPSRLRHHPDKHPAWYVEASIAGQHAQIVGWFSREEDAHEVGTDWAAKGYSVRVSLWTELLLPAMPDMPTE